ncbi:hypothetical protein [Actinocorallia longicatena]|uniref:Uncharacterized protein n=1 Tax=Actinocorallia longicatena TaxID=111803 RepID=A0ABP6QDZ1_9ACTN
MEDETRETVLIVAAAAVVAGLAVLGRRATAGRLRRVEGEQYRDHRRIENLAGAVAGLLELAEDEVGAWRKAHRR